MLGRADDARAFIMHEQDEAVVELTLAPLPGGETHTIVRKIERHKGSEKGNGRGASTFYINKKLKKHKEVNELIKETYNITIDNLCTFLPQVGTIFVLELLFILFVTQSFSQRGCIFIFLTNAPLH